MGPVGCHGWREATFIEWLEAHGPVQAQPTPTGRLLKEPIPQGLDRQVSKLLAALLPLAESYPLPHFRLKR